MYYVLLKYVLLMYYHTDLMQAIDMHCRILFSLHVSSCDLVQYYYNYMKSGVGLGLFTRNLLVLKKWSVLFTFIMLSEETHYFGQGQKLL